MKKILIIAFTLALVACGQSGKKTVEAVEGWKKIDESAYAIQYPQDWEMTKGTMGSLFFLYSPMESDTDQFRENINLVSESVAGMGMTMDKYAEISQTQIAAYFNNFSLIKSEKVSDYYNLVYSGTQGIFDLMFDQRFYIHKNTAYVLTFSAEKDKYQNYKDTADEILSTFILK